MNTPIADFVKQYENSSCIRLHMPGHKGRTVLGPEPLDITEIAGADVLYHGSGIIAESERNAASLFGTCQTHYVTEGSTLAIRAMIFLACLYARRIKRKPIIAAGRNAHQAFLTSAAWMDAKIDWLLSKEKNSLLQCSITADDIESYLAHSAQLPAAIYLTSPDYLGNLLNIKAIAEICHRYGCLLLVDNAHGAYLHFLPLPLHPIDLGADLCSDSAHKTLPALTGCAYLHVSHHCPKEIADQAAVALSLFASSSPSYLLLQSLDLLNNYLSKEYSDLLLTNIGKIDRIKQNLSEAGYTFAGHEPLKITIKAKSYGYRGTDIAALLREQKIEPEYADPDVVVLMLSADQADSDLVRMEQSLLSIEKRAPLTEPTPSFLRRPNCILSPREALLSNSIELPTALCKGRILASPSITCPPAISIAVCGERLDEQSITLFEYYGIQKCRVVDNYIT